MNRYIYKLIEPKTAICGFIVYTMVFVTISCAPKKDDVKPVLLGDDVVLARVNGKPVTKYDLDASMKSGFVASIQGTPSKEMRKKLLESLVNAKLLALVQEKNLTRKQAAELEKIVDAYREKLLAQMYLNKSELLKPVTREMLTEYYNAHPEEFGASKLAKYELITTKRSLALSERKGVLDKLATVSGEADWRQWVLANNGDTFPVAYRRGTSAADSLKGKLKDIVVKLDEGDVSGVTIIDGRAYVVRIISVENTPPESLMKVRPRIRKKLEAAAMKEALGQAIKKELKIAKVEFL